MAIEPHVSCSYVEVLELRLVLLDGENLLDSILHIEESIVRIELRLVFADHREVQDVVNEEVDELSGCCHLLAAFAETSEY